MYLLSLRCMASTVGKQATAQIEPMGLAVYHYSHKYKRNCQQNYVHNWLTEFYVLVDSSIG